MCSREASSGYLGDLHKTFGLARIDARKTITPLQRVAYPVMERPATPLLSPTLS